MIGLLRTEWTKAVVRTRTLAVAVALVGLPMLISVAIRARGNRAGRQGEGLFRLASTSGLLVAPAVLAAMSGFLLVVVAGILAGDSVASDAAWGNLRYVLLRPVSRAKLVLAKALVATVLVWAATALVSLAAFGIGVALFGWHPVVVPPAGTAAVVRFTLSTGVLLGRAGLATGYVAFGYTALVAIGTLASTLTDSVAGAIGATIGVYIVSEIFDSITALGAVRYGLPTHYLDAWQTMFTANHVSGDMVAGVFVQLAYVAVFGSLAVWWFRRKDIVS